MNKEMVAMYCSKGISILLLHRVMPVPVLFVIFDKIQLQIHRILGMEADSRPVQLRGLFCITKYRVLHIEVFYLR